MVGTPALLVDMGGTHTRLAVRLPGGELAQPECRLNAQYDSPQALLEDYLRGLEAELRPRRGALAVASPVSGDLVALTNHPWRFSVGALGAALGLAPLHVLNDFTAIALAIPHLEGGDTLQIGGGRAEARAPIAVLGPGTGLGVSGLLPAGEGWVAIAGEGGHVTMPAVTAEEAALLEALRERYGHVSAERVLSGPGLLDLYRFFAAGRAEAERPEQVTELALRHGNAAALAALKSFFAFLGTVAGDLALTLGARGGVYLAGGILPRVAAALAASEFRGRFAEKGRYRPYLEAIPTFLIVHPCPAFKGLASLLQDPSPTRGGSSAPPW